MSIYNKVRHKTAPPKNEGFFSLFYPIASPMHSTGIVAQLISAATEGILIFWIVSTNIPNKLGIAAGILAAILVVCVLELGGRKFLQVLTRQIVWKEWGSLWHKVLFLIVALVTVGIFSQSLILSTKGIGLALSPTPKKNIDTKAITSQRDTMLHNAKEEREASILFLEQANKAQLIAIGDKWQPDLNHATRNIRKYKIKSQNGEKWATSHGEKWENKKSRTLKEKNTELSMLSEQTAREKQRIISLYEQRAKMADSLFFSQKAELKSMALQEHEQQQKKYNGYATILRGVVGLSVILAFVCIVVVEVYNRGSEAKTVAITTAQPSSTKRIFAALGKKWGDKVRALADRLEGTQPPVITNKIGFNITNSTTPKNNITDPEILSMAIKNAKTFAAAYRNKKPTPNNKKRLKEWESKILALENLISQQHNITQ